jgi:LysR substrate binding domain-containing protein
MAICVIAVVGEAPCQCLSPGANQTTSPGRISSTWPPARCTRPSHSPAPLPDGREPLRVMSIPPPSRALWTATSGDAASSRAARSIARRLIHYGEFIEQDMVAIRVSPDHRPAIVGSPMYFESYPRPKLPRALLQHRCINFRHGPDEIYRWEFDKGKQSLTVAVSGPLIVDDVELVIRAALDGVGLAYLGEDLAAPLERGSLVRVLDAWCQPFPGSRV